MGIEAIRGVLYGAAPACIENRVEVDGAHESLDHRPHPLLVRTLLDDAQYNARQVLRHHSLYGRVAYEARGPHLEPFPLGTIARFDNRRAALAPPHPKLHVLPYGEPRREEPDGREVRVWDDNITAVARNARLVPFPAPVPVSDVGVAGRGARGLCGEHEIVIRKHLRPRRVHPSARRIDHQHRLAPVFHDPDIRERVARRRLQPQLAPNLGPRVLQLLRAAGRALCDVHATGLLVAAGGPYVRPVAARKGPDLPFELGNEQCVHSEGLRRRCSCPRQRKIGERRLVFFYRVRVVPDHQRANRMLRVVDAECRHSRIVVASPQVREAPIVAAHAPVPIRPPVVGMRATVRGKVLREHEALRVRCVRCASLRFCCTSYDEGSDGVHGAFVRLSVQGSVVKKRVYALD